MGGEGGSIPQVDGAADSDHDAAAFQKAHITDKLAAVAGSGAAMIGIHPVMTTAAAEAPIAAAADDEQHPPTTILTHAVEAAAIGEDGCMEAAVPWQRSNVRAELQPAGPEASQAAQQPAAAADVRAEPRAPDMEPSNLQQVAGIAGLAAGGAQQVGRPHDIAGGCIERDCAPATPHASGLEPAPAAAAAEHAHAPASPSALGRDVVEPSGHRTGHRSLTDDELAALPVLVRVLREWLDAQTGHISGDWDLRRCTGSTCDAWRQSAMHARLEPESTVCGAPWLARHQVMSVRFYASDSELDLHKPDYLLSESAHCSAGGP